MATQHVSPPEGPVYYAMHPIGTGYDFFQGHPYYKISNYTDWNKYTAEFSEASPDPACDVDKPDWRDNPECIPVLSESVSAYATRETVDDTIDWISLHSEQPWFAILSFHAAHRPFHGPPADDPDCPGPGNLDCTNDSPSCYRAMIEAMDCHIGRLLNGLPADDKLENGNTTIIFVGDNGSPAGMACYLFDPDRAKMSLYEDGINVTLIIAGAGVSGTDAPCEALVNTTDLFMTVLELAGVDPNVLPTHLPYTDHARYNGQAWEHDSFSFVPILNGSVESIREYAYAEISLGSRRTIRNRAGYKLIRSLAGTWEFYDLNADRWEETNLVDGLVEPGTGKLLGSGLLDPQAEAAYLDLSHKLEDMHGPKLPAATLDADADAIVNDEDNCAAFANPDQLDTNQDGYGNACDADYDDDDDVDGDDYAAFLAAFGRGGQYDPDIDCNGDGAINGVDYVCFASPEGLPPGPSGLGCAGTVPCVASE